MRRHDEPNEYGFAGDATAPQPQRGGADERDRAEAVAVPGDDLTGELSDALVDETGQDRETEQRR